MFIFGICTNSKVGKVASTEHLTVTKHHTIDTIDPFVHIPIYTVYFDKSHVSLNAADIKTIIVIYLLHFSKSPYIIYIINYIYAIKKTHNDLISLQYHRS